MDYKSFTKKELTGILDVIQDTTACTDEEGIVGIINRLKEMVNAETGICALGDVETCTLLKIINLNYPAEWANIYTSEALYKNDPIVRYNYEFFRTHHWSEAMEVYNDETHVDLMNRASEFGLRHGLSAGVNGPRFKGSIFSFSSDTNRFHEHHKKILDIVTPHIHPALVRICDAQIAFDEDLSAREKEVLTWMKEGKTNWEISVILSISERTVKFHVQNIERKLNAVNKAHAIAIAMNGGLVV